MSSTASTVSRIPMTSSFLSPRNSLFSSEMTPRTIETAARISRIHHFSAPRDFRSKAYWIFRKPPKSSASPQA